MRYVSIDILRTIAIVLMVVVHFVENLSGVGNLAPTGFAAPLFTFLSGVSYRLWVGGQQARGRKDSEISKVTLRRGMFLFGVGFLFNILVWLPEDTFNWDILTFIGAALMFLNLVRKLPGSISVLICLLVYVFSPVFRAQTDYPSYWVNDYFRCELVLSEVLLGFFVNGFFPVFPWIIFPVAGYLFATRMFPEVKGPAPATNGLIALGALLVAASAATMFFRTYAPALVQSVWLKGWTMFPASASYVLGTLGIAVLASVLGHLWIDRAARFGKESLVARIASTFSTHSFTIYLLHHVVHLWPLWIYGLVAGGEPTQFWQNALPATWSWPLGIAFIPCCYLLLRAMDRLRIPGVENLMRWLCD